MDKNLPSISLILPAYNEEALIGKSLGVITEYIRSKSEKYNWEVIIINDGSSDRTGMLADEFADNYEMIRVIHHSQNMNLGRALQTGFRNACGDLIVVLDLDLSYSVGHLERMIDKQLESDADIVIASPYMKDGKVSNVPFIRALFSRTVNWFMRMASQEKYYTFTGMVRAYKASFIKNLNLKTTDYEINPEIIYKAMIIRAKIVEIPAHLDWSYQNEFGSKRKSGIRILRSFFSGLMAGFIFRPYIFFISFGAILFLISSYIIVWILINTFQIMPSIEIEPEYFDDKFSQAIGIAYNMRPHAFYIGGITLILAIQILSLGFISLQKKRYFEELFHINSSILRQAKSQDKTEV